MIENLGPIDINLLLECYTRLEPEIQWSDYTDKRQTSVQYIEGGDIWLSAVGKSKGRELEYDKLNPLYAGTIFEAIIKQFNLKRTRLMWVSARSCYSMHSDTTPRVHVPIITYPDSYFVFKHKPPLHLSLGSIYRVDTRLPHTFMNCSENPRLHLVGAIEK